MSFLHRLLDSLCSRAFSNKANAATLSPEKRTAGTALPTCEERLAHLRTLGFAPHIIYDCGAFNGKWARATHALFPTAKFVLIEPNPSLHSAILANTADFRDQCRLFGCAVSSGSGKATLNVWNNPKHKNPETALAASSLQTHVQGEPTTAVEVETMTIDSIVSESAMVPDLLKLDLQGHELPALAGASNALRQCELVISEFGCLEAYIDRTTPRDLMNILYDLDFVLYDIVDLRYRPYDGALTGGDFFFVKKSSQLKTHKDYF